MRGTRQNGRYQSPRARADNHPTLGNQRSYQPLEQVGLDLGEIGLGLLAQSLDFLADGGDISLDRSDIGLGGKVTVSYSVIFANRPADSSAGLVLCQRKGAGSHACPDGFTRRPR